MESRLLTCPKVRLVLMLLNHSLMLIDILLFLNLTKMLLTESLESRKRLYFSLMMTSILKVPRFSENSLLTMSIILMDLFTVYLRLPMVSDRD
jgi:hypothetical protein